MKLYVKYMVSNRCKLAVIEELRKIDLPYVQVDLGEIELCEDASLSQIELLREGLKASGLELMDEKKAILIERIKNVVIQMVHHSDDIVKVNFSSFLSTKLNHNYTYLANLFSEVQGVTLEHFLIYHKIERIKELIIYGEMNISEIAWKMNYSSVSHLSNQFKKFTGLTPSHFRQLKYARRSPIEGLGATVSMRHPSEVPR